MRDHAPRAAAARLRVIETLLGEFDRAGFERVITPAFEYEEVLALGLGAAARAVTVRFVEPSSGQVVALRPDITPQIARLIATRFRDHKGPVRLCYEGTVVRLDRAARGQRELSQAGVELAGLAGPDGDAEVIALAVEALAAVGLPRPTIDLGHLGLAREVLASLALPEPALEEARRCIAKRDGAGLDVVLGAARGARPALAFARRLPELSGAPSLLAPAAKQAPTAGIKRAITELSGHRRRRREAAASTPGCTSTSARCAGSTTTPACASRPSSPARPTPSCAAAVTTICSARYGRESPAVGFAVDVEAVAGALEAQVSPSARTKQSWQS